MLKLFHALRLKMLKWHLMHLFNFYNNKVRGAIQYEGNVT